MIIRSRAPLRLGLAGGGTDVSPYCDEYGGAVLNVTIDQYAYTIIEPMEDDRVCFTASDIGSRFEAAADEAMELADPLILHRAVYRRIVTQFNEAAPCHAASPPSATHRPARGWAPLQPWSSRWSKPSWSG
jgi:D-glycero-alpha-D-manno-heptose-7-phosphate kinase